MSEQGVTMNANASTNNKSTSLSGATLRSDLQTLKSDLDTLLSHASELTDIELNEAHERILTKFGAMRQTARGLATEAGRQFTHGVEVTTGYVKEKPVQSIALAVGFGTLLGIIIGRR
jgi:ElaB/YqjD/DUF883 family membrane-anchored ribosome-binding protein